VKEKVPEKSAASLPLLAAEIAVYAGLAAAYLAFAVKALAPFLRGQAEHHRAVYVLLCLGLMLGQGIVLELLTTLLVRVFAGRTPARQSELRIGAALRFRACQSPSPAGNCDGASISCPRFAARERA
jgi:hypothetical protein